jgi:hypothetical protein
LNISIKTRIIKFYSKNLQLLRLIDKIYLLPARLLSLPSLIMPTSTFHNAKLPVLIGISFLLALVLNISFNWYYLSWVGKTQLSTYEQNRMTSAADKLIYLDRQKSWPILFLGSSQVHWGVNPEVFTNLNGFNLGMKGTYFKSQDFILDLLLKQRKKPSLVIIECSPILTNIHQPEFLVKKELIPYLVATNSLDIFAQIKSDKSNIIKIFQALQTRDWLDWLVGKGHTKTHLYNQFGFEAKEPLPLDKQARPDTYSRLDPSNVIHYQFDESAMVSIIYRLKKAQVPFIFVQYPVTPALKAKLKKEGIQSAFDKTVLRLSKSHYIQYWDLSSIPILNKNYRTYFIDGNHLNRDGSLIFSKLLEAKLEQYAF